MPADKENTVKGIKNLFNEITAENISNLRNDMDINVQKEVYRTPNRHEQKRSSPQHVVIKQAKLQDEEGF
jgi:hypothetical protein